MSIVFDARRKAERSKREQDGITGSPEQKPSGPDSSGSANADVPIARGNSSGSAGMGQRGPLVRSLLRIPRVEPGSTAQYPPVPLKSGEAANTATVVFPKDPIYPAIAKERFISGLVEVCFRIGLDGRVYEVSAVRGPSILVQAAMQAVTARRYEPARVNGVAIDSQATAQFDFRLS